MSCWCCSKGYCCVCAVSPDVDKLYCGVCELCGYEQTAVNSLTGFPFSETIAWTWLVLSSMREQYNWMKKKAEGQSKNNINTSYFKTSEGVLYAKEKLDLLFHSLFSAFTPFKRGKATSEWLDASDGLYKRRRSLQMAKINMCALLKDMFTQTICSASEIMNKWRFHRNNWKDFCVSADAITEWHRRNFYLVLSMLHVLAVPFSELNTSFCSYFTRVFVRNCRLLLQFWRVAWFPRRNLAASKDYLDLVGQERGGPKGRTKSIHLIHRTLFA